LFPLLRLFISSIDENTREGGQSAKNCDQPLRVTPCQDEAQATKDRRHCDYEREQLAASFVGCIAVDDGALKGVSVCLLAFGHRENPLSAIGNDLVVLSENGWRWYRALKGGQLGGDSASGW
jgi:hypothetical protein